MRKANQRHRPRPEMTLRKVRSVVVNRDRRSQKHVGKHNCTFGAWAWIGTAALLHFRSVGVNCRRWLRDATSMRQGTFGAWAWIVGGGSETRPRCDRASPERGRGWRENLSVISHRGPATPERVGRAGKIINSDSQVFFGPGQIKQIHIRIHTCMCIRVYTYI